MEEVRLHSAEALGAVSLCASSQLQNVLSGSTSCVWPRPPLSLVGSQLHSCCAAAADARSVMSVGDSACAHLARCVATWYGLPGPLCTNRRERGASALSKPQIERLYSGGMSRGSCEWSKRRSPEIGLVYAGHTFR